MSVGVFFLSVKNYTCSLHICFNIKYNFCQASIHLLLEGKKKNSMGYMVEGSASAILPTSASDVGQSIQIRYYFCKQTFVFRLSIVLGCFPLFIDY